MLPVLHRASAVAFYTLGSTFFLAALLLRNGIGGMWPAWWLQVTDLPLALSALTYAGLSLFLSLRPRESDARLLAASIAIPLAAFFLFLCVINFWPW